MGSVYSLYENVTRDIQIVASLWLLRLRTCDIYRWILGSAQMSLAAQTGKGLWVEWQFAE